MAALDGHLAGSRRTALGAAPRGFALRAQRPRFRPRTDRLSAETARRGDSRRPRPPCGHRGHHGCRGSGDAAQTERRRRVDASCNGHFSMSCVAPVASRHVGSAPRSTGDHVRVQAARIVAIWPVLLAPTGGLSVYTCAGAWRGAGVAITMALAVSCSRGPALPGAAAAPLLLPAVGACCTPYRMLGGGCVHAGCGGGTGSEDEEGGDGMEPVAARDSTVTKLAGSMTYSRSEAALQNATAAVAAGLADGAAPPADRPPCVVEYEIVDVDVGEEVGGEDVGEDISEGALRGRANGAVTDI